MPKSAIPSPLQQAGQFAETGGLRTALECYSGPGRLDHDAIDVIVRAVRDTCAPAPSRASSEQRVNFAGGNPQEEAKLERLVTRPFAAIHDLATSLREVDREVGEIRNLIDNWEDDDFCPLVHRVDEKLRELEAHLCGTDIGFATDFGAWLTTAGWVPGSELPFLRDEPASSTRGEIGEPS